MNDTLTSRTVIAADGSRLHMEGTGQPVWLMLHGLGYASWEADELRDLLAAGQGLWSLDNRGTGRSAPSDGPFSIEQLADDAAEAIVELGEPLLVIGHSMGGYIAQSLAQRHPEKLRGLVLIATSPGGPRSEPVPETTTRAWLAAAGASPEQYARTTMPLSFRAGWTDEHPDTFERLLASRLAHPTPQTTWRAQFEACQRFLSRGISPSTLAVPTLVLHGSADRVVPVTNGRLLRAELPDVRYREIVEAGHLVHFEAPSLVADEIQTFTTNCT